MSAGLAEVPGLAVVSRERILEVLREMGRPADADDPALAVRVGREVGAHGVVSGAYQSLGDRIRVTARVTETATGRVAFNPRVDGARDAIFELQDRLVAELVAGLRGQLPAARPEETQSLEAYEACSKGLLNFQEESQESIDRAIVFFERAVALDPGYARAHMLLGAALDLKGDYLTTPELSERALVSLDRALALRPDSAEAWRYRGSALITLNRDEEALAAFESALARNPMDASAQSGIARVHFILRGDFARAVAGLRAGPRPQPPGRLERPPARALRDAAAGLPEGRGRGPPRDRAAAGLPLRARGDGASSGPTCASATRLALQGRHREALEEYAREVEFLRSVDHALRARIFIELHQRIGEAHLRLGETAAGRAALDLAIEAYERRMRTGADDPMSPYYAAGAHALRGDAGRRPRLPGAGRGRAAPAHRRPRRDRAGARVASRRAALPRGRRAARRLSAPGVRPSGRRRRRPAPSPPPRRGGGPPGRGAARARS